LQCQSVSSSIILVRLCELPGLPSNGTQNERLMLSARASEPVEESPSLKVALLLLLAVWAFCRAYHFAFYVIEHYADPGYRFAGLVSFLRYAWRKRTHV